jgi:pantothenate kinase
MADTESMLANRVRLLLEKYHGFPQRRILPALAGGPGSGKSTISSAFAKYWNERNAEQIQVFPMVQSFAGAKKLTERLSFFTSCSFQTAELGMLFSEARCTFHI